MNPTTKAAAAAYYTIDGVVIDGDKYRIALGLAREYGQLAQRGSTARLAEMRDQMFGLVGRFGEWDPVRQRYARVLPSTIVDAMGEAARQYRREM